MNKINTILVVDDSELDQLNAQYAIEDYDPSIQILKAYDGQEALDILSTLSSPPELLFLDINMPGMDGHEFLLKYSECAYSNIVIVMLTSSDQEQDKAKCEQYEFVRDYAIKPLDSEYLSTLAEQLP